MICKKELFLCSELPSGIQIQDPDSRSGFQISDLESKIQDPRSGSGAWKRRKERKSTWWTLCAQRKRTMHGNTDAARDNGQGCAKGAYNAHHVHKEEKDAISSPAKMIAHRARIWNPGHGNPCWAWSVQDGRKERKRACMEERACNKGIEPL